jgi:hypothetical protein
MLQHDHSGNLGLRWSRRSRRGKLHLRIGPHGGGDDRAQQRRGGCAIPQSGLTRGFDPTDEATPGSQIYLSFLHALYESYVYSSACLSQACIYVCIIMHLLACMILHVREGDRQNAASDRDGGWRGCQTLGLKINPKPGGYKKERSRAAQGHIWPAHRPIAGWLFRLRCLCVCLTHRSSQQPEKVDSLCVPVWGTWKWNIANPKTVPES